MKACRFAITTGLAGLLVLLLAPTIQAQNLDEPIEEEIFVFESRLLLDLSQVTSRPKARLAPEDVVVYEGGAALPATSIVPLPDAGAWRTVIYVDAPMARGFTIRKALLALGDFAIDLAALGTIEIVIADPEPRVAFPAEKRSSIIESALARLAGQELEDDQYNRQRSAFRDRLRDGSVSSRERSAAMLDEVELIRRQADALQRFATSGGNGQPAILFLITDGYYLQPEIFYFKDVATPDQLPGENVGAIAAEVAQTLAAYEWVVVPLPLRTGDVSTEVTTRPSTDYQEFEDASGGIRMLPKGSDRNINLNLEALEASVSPVLQPLGLYSDQTAGVTIRVDSQLQDQIAGLSQRWWIYYRTTRPLAGEVLTASASLSSTARGLKTASWVRSGSSAAAVDAHLRWLMSGQSIDFGRAPNVVPQVTPRDGGVDVAVRWQQDALLLKRGWVRFSVAWEDNEVVRTEHVVLGAGLPNGEGLWEYSVDLPAGVGAGAILAVEALQFGDWGIHQL